MGNVPVELLTMLFSTLLGGVMSVWGQSIKARQAQNEMLLERANFRAGAVDQAREAGLKNLHFAWTRRSIALMAVFSIIVLPKLISVWSPEIAVVVGYTEVEGGLSGWLFGDKDVTVWREARGFVITPLDTHMVSAIVGLYFGAGFTK